MMNGDLPKVRKYVDDAGHPLWGTSRQRRGAPKGDDSDGTRGLMGCAAGLKLVPACFNACTKLRISTAMLSAGPMMATALEVSHGSGRIE